MSQFLRKSSTVAVLTMAGAFAASLLGVPAPASAEPACSSFAPDSQSLDTFRGCTVQGGGNAGQDFITNVQAALDFVLADDVDLIPEESYFPGGGTKAGDEFEGDVAGLFEVEPDELNNNITFTFSQLPLNTAFLTMKAGNGFEIFNLAVTGTTDLTHQLTPDSTSHFSTFAVDDLPPIEVPEPASLAMLGGALIGFGLLRRRKRA